MEYLKHLIMLKQLLSVIRKAMVYIIMLSLIGVKSFAQDIEPRRWTLLPQGIHVIGAGYGYTNGEIFFDPLLQVEDATVDVNSFVVQYIHPFKIGNRLARLDVLLPYSTARWKGLLAGVPTTVKRNGFADPRFRISLNIVGPPPMGPKEMQEYLVSHPVHTIVGVSIAVTLPLGQYFEDKLLNIGQNRFVFRPQLGMIHNWRNWSYELTGSVFLYTRNHDFFNGDTRKQDPVYALQTHLIRRFKNRTWVALSAGYGLGGQSIVNKNPNRDERGDILGAVSFGFPLMKKQAIKLVYVRSQTLKSIGADTNTIVLGWSAVY